MSEIIFLGHDRTNDDDARRQVRSRAAQHSHRSGLRKPKAKKPKTKRAGKSSSLEPGPSLSRRGSSISVATSATSASRGFETDEEEQEEENKDGLEVAMRAQRPTISRLGSYADEPFDSYPVPAQPWFGETLDYMWPFMRRGWASLHTTNAEQDEAMPWVKRTIMNEPAYFYMNMLCVMDDLVSRLQKDPRLLVWLTGQVVASINEALGDPAKSLSVGTILTVGRLALREIVVGDMNSGITYHRPAFARMLVMAGGVEALKLPPLVRSHLAWNDRMMTRKTRMTIAQIESSLAHETTFGVERSEQEDMRVLDTYLPYRTRRPGSAGEEAGEAARSKAPDR